jgi:hypothetical protein
MFWQPPRMVVFKYMATSMVFFSECGKTKKHQERILNSLQEKGIA